MNNRNDIFLVALHELLLSQLSRALLEKLIVAHLAKKSCSIFETRGVITMFTTPATEH
jgi:hypothetical protein